jgi:AGCS family alanine or glycine:cation symporter
MRKNRLFILIFLGFFAVEGFGQKKDSTLVTNPASPSISKQIDQAFQPIVSAMGSVIFWDPFASIGLYDPIVKDEKGEPLKNKMGIPVQRGIPFVVLWLVLGALYFTFKLRFVSIRGFKHGLDLLMGRYDDPKDRGEVSHFQALATALSGTVGLGNIAGVAMAVATGGPGATFWLIVAGFLGMTSKFVECTMAVKYRLINTHGVVFGGPMYYLSKGLSDRGMPRFGGMLAGLFALLCIGGSIGGGNMFQANQAFSQLSSQFPQTFDKNVDGFWFGLVMAVLVGLVIIGGIKSIAKVTDKLVPLMAVLYLSICSYILFLHYDKIGMALGIILSQAFSPEAIYGGFLGTLVQGFRRAAFSNEAGVGSAAIAHSAAKTNEPVSEGIVALLEPFIDTIVICTFTSLVIVITGAYETGLQGTAITSVAFSSGGSIFPHLLTISIILFGFSTMISWSYYGEKAWTYLFGRSRQSVMSYKLMFLTFIVIGSSVQELNSVIDFSDMMILCMAFPNILGLYFMATEVKADTDIYFAKLKSGEIKRYH